jgi:hypothetical protein
VKIGDKIKILVGRRQLTDEELAARKEAEVIAAQLAQDRATTAATRDTNQPILPP